MSFRSAALAALFVALLGCTPNAPAPQPLPTVRPTVEPDAPPADGNASTNDSADPETPEESGDGPLATADPPAADPPAADPDAGPKPEKLVVEGDTGPPPAELFHNWPQPALAIVISGEMNGYIEPCGCAGLENQKGGLSRRHTFLEDLAGKGWDIARLDLGNLVQRFGRQSEIKFHTAVDALRTMQYDAVGWGPHDLRLPADDLVAEAAAENGPFLAANIDLAGLLPRSRVIERGGRKLGVTTILGAEYQRRVNNELIAFSPAEDALAEVVAELEPQCDYLVLLSHATKQESTDLARKFPDFDLVVTAGGADEPPIQPEPIEGQKTLLLEVGHKGMYLGVLGLFDDPERPFRYQLVPLDKRFEDSPAMRQLMASYQGQLRELGWNGLQVSPIPHPRGHGFVGSNRCGECHTKAFEIWEGTPHAHATETLANLEIPRQYDAECISCHSTGWEPQRFVPFQTGFSSLEETPLLVANGCENCHGPGSAHVAAETGETDTSEAEKTALREQLRMRLDTDAAKANVAETCRGCHDLDNSPEFEHKGFDEYWSHVQHKGLD